MVTLYKFTFLVVILLAYTVSLIMFSLFLLFSIFETPNDLHLVFPDRSILTDDKCSADRGPLTEDLRWRWHASDDKPPDDKTKYDGVGHVTWQRVSWCYNKGNGSPTRSIGRYSNDTVSITADGPDFITDIARSYYGKHAHNVDRCDAKANVNFTINRGPEKENLKQTMHLQVLGVSQMVLLLSIFSIPRSHFTSGEVFKLVRLTNSSFILTLNLGSQFIVVYRYGICK